MNRIEIIGLFSALDKMLAKGNTEDVREVVQAVLSEARRGESKGGKTDGERESEQQ